MNRTRRLIVFHSENGPTIGGSDKYLGQLIDSMDPQQWDVALIARPGYPLDQVCHSSHRVKQLLHGPKVERRSRQADAGPDDIERPSQLRCRRDGWGRVWQFVPRPIRRDVGMWRDIGRVERMLRDLQPDILHTMDGGAQPVALGASRAGARVVMSYCAPPPAHKLTGWQRYLEKRGLAEASALIVKSEFARNAWAEYLRTDSARFHVIPNGIKLPTTSRQDAISVRAELKIPSNQLVIGMTGRLELEKGAGVLALAIPRLLQRYANITVVIAGDGSQVTQMERVRRESGAAERFHLLGFRHDVRRITAGYDIALFPSVWNEPFGWVALEAMAAAKPVVASDVGGIPEVVRHEETGLLVTPDSPDALVRAVARLIEDPQLRRHLGSRGQQRVIDCFSREQMIHQTHVIYQSLVGATAPSESRRSA